MEFYYATMAEILVIFIVNNKKTIDLTIVVLTNHIYFFNYWFVLFGLS